MMFKPQRPSRLVDLFAQEKNFQLHCSRIQEIRYSSTSRVTQRYQEDAQEKYLAQLLLSKREVKERFDADRRKNNRSLFERVFKAYGSLDEPSNRYIKHFHSYFTMKKDNERIRQDNCTMMARMISQSSLVPSLSQLKHDFRQSRKRAKLCQKLPRMMKHYADIKQQFSAEKSHKHYHTRRL